MIFYSFIANRSLINDQIGKAVAELVSRAVEKTPFEGADTVRLQQNL